MEDRETPRMHKYGESKTTHIMMPTVRHATAGGRTKYQATWFLLNSVYTLLCHQSCKTKNRHHYKTQSINYSCTNNPQLQITSGT